MPEFLTTPFASGTNIHPMDVIMRLLVALAMGWVVAWIYRKSRKSSEITPSFPVTLVLLSVLIAMVTQVIGDNVARAFSLVGALSIVRFRTVVRDTQDTAFVIFSVVIGMAVGASNLWVGAIGIGVIGLASFLTMIQARSRSAVSPVFRLQLRVVHDMDIKTVLGGTLDEYLLGMELLSAGTSKKGMSLDVTYEGHLQPSKTPDNLVKALNKIEGVQSAEMVRVDADLG